MDLISITSFLNWFLMLAMPVLLGIYLVHKFNLSWRIWLIGAATFIISQVFHLPFNKYILTPIFGSILDALPESTALLVISLLAGLSAGVFEECSRYGMFRWWIKEAHTWRNAVLAGAGHGGIEAIIIGVVVMLQYFNLMAYRYIDLSYLNLAPEQLSRTLQTLQIYWGLSWYDSLLGALERAFTIPFHIAASVIVLQVFTRKPGRFQHGWLFMAILYHTIVDASIVFIARQMGAYVAEAVLGVTVIFDLVIIFALRQSEPEASTPVLVPLEILAYTPKPIEETSDNLENTRFQ